jgi:MoxR-like ATPase
VVHAAARVCHAANRRPVATLAGHRILPAMSAALARLTTALSAVFRGDGTAVDLLATAFAARGHALIEDIPGVGKTTLARTLAAATGGVFRRLQCTPDLMPTDVIGVSVWDEGTRAFRFQPGPVFCDVLLADELNRTPPRTQSALLEAMNEGRVTVEGEARPLPARFFCIATQNPHDQAGTYPLPDSQRDRFLISFRLGYPDAAAEAALLARDGAEDDLAQAQAVLDEADVAAVRAAARAVRLEASVRDYLVGLVRATRNARGLAQGASPRAALGLQRAVQARALLRGRDYALPDDVQALFAPCLAHRVVARAGQQADIALAAVLESVAAPR